MKKRPLILLTNDDGFEAPGIRILAEAMTAYGDVVAVAPMTPQSGMSSAITVGSALKISEKTPVGDARIFAVNGTPVDCVKLAIHTILGARPDMLVSGINHGANSGNSVIYSGTMGAVMEGCFNGIPSVGLSLLHHSLKADFTLSREYWERICVGVLENGLPEDLCLNVNIPAKITPKGVRTCRAAKGYWTEEYARYLDPSGNPFFWLTGRFVNREPEAEDTDLYWLDRGFISVVPVTPDQTAISHLKPTVKRFDV